MRFPTEYDDVYRSTYMMDMIDKTFPDRAKNIAEHKCSSCGKGMPEDIEELQSVFMDEISWREYLISGMCQACQNDFYGWYMK